MSGQGFHVHGPHDHASGGMINQIAMFTAIIATIGAIFGYVGCATQAKSTKQSPVLSDLL